MKYFESMRNIWRNLRRWTPLRYQWMLGQTWFKRLAGMKLFELWRCKLRSCTSTELREWEWTVDSWWGRGFLRFCSLKNFELWGTKRQKSDKERAVAIGWNAHVPPSICDPRQMGTNELFTIHDPSHIRGERLLSVLLTTYKPMSLEVR